MHASLVFSFPVDVSAADAIHAVANHFAVGVSIMGAPANVPAHIKAAVESFAPGGVHHTAHALTDGAETSPAVAFGGLLNGAAGNDQATAEHAQSSAVVATSTIAHAAQPDTLATLPPASSAPALPPGALVAVAHAAPVAPVNPAANVEFDSTGLPWDERIHSGNKTKNPGGEWRTKKGVDKGLLTSVTAELRAAVGNVAVPVASASPTNAPVSVDPLVKRQQAIAFADAEAIRVCGASPISDSVLQGLLSGKPATLAPHEADWYNAYFAKRNAAFVEYMARPNVAIVPQDATASAPTTGNEAAAQPAAPLTTAASPTPGATTVAPVTVAPQGELDATGLPHDPRINVGAKIKDGAGVWVQRHDVAPAEKLAIMAELRQALAGNVAVQASNTAPAPESTPVAPTPAVVAVSADDAKGSFAKMMQWIVANQIAKRIAPTAGPDAAKSLGFSDANGNGSLALMTQQDAYWPYIVEILQGQGAV